MKAAQKDLTHAHAAIPLMNLAVWDGNTRRTAVDENLEELTASIAAHGLLQPLVILRGDKANENNVVVAGQRRLLALQKLADTGVIGHDYLVPCTVVGVKEAHEISLAENVIRADMHPADQYEAFKDLAQAGMSIADIAARFGIEENHVTKLLKLGRVAPALIEAYRAEKLDLEQLQAFTVTDDHAEQLRVWEAISKLHPSAWGAGASSIRKALTTDEVAATDKRVRFVGFENYAAAGGAVRRDLFDEDNAGWVLDVALLNKMVTDKMHTLAESLRAEGWSWVEVRDSFSWQDMRPFIEEDGKRPALTPAEKEAVKELEDELKALEKIEQDDELTAEQDARKDAIEERLEQIEERPKVYAKAVMKRSGVILSIGYGGVLEVHRGLTKKADAPKKKDKTGTADNAPASDLGFTVALKRELSMQADAALQAELVSKPTIAFRAMAFAIVRDMYSGVCVSARLSEQSIDDESKAGKTVEKAMEKATDGMPDTYDNDALWKWVFDMTDAQIIKLLTPYIARSASRGEAGSEQLEKALNFRVRSWYTPTAENYFSKVGKDQILADMKEMGMTESAVANYAKLKKGEIADGAEQYLKKHAPDWLPIPMREVEADQEDDFGSDDDEE